MPAGGQQVSKSAYGDYWSSTRGAHHDQEHRERLAPGTDEEEFAATSLVDERERDACGQGVYGGKDGTEDERELAAETEVLFEDRSREVCFEDVSLESPLLENMRKRTDDRIATADLYSSFVSSARQIKGYAPTDLLEKLRRGSEEHAAGMLGRSVRDQVALALASLALERVVDDLELQDDGSIVVGRRLERGDNLLGLGIVTLRDEPTRGLGQEEKEGDQRDGEDTLQSDRDTP